MLESPGVIWSRTRDEDNIFPSTTIVSDGAILVTGVDKLALPEFSRNLCVVSTTDAVEGFLIDSIIIEQNVPTLIGAVVISNSTLQLLCPEFETVIVNPALPHVDALAFPVAVPSSTKNGIPN